MPSFTAVTLEALPQWARELLESERVARLAYVDSGDQPRVLPVTFAVADGAVWSAIDEKPKRTPQPARLRYLRRRPAAALLLDVYDDDWSRLAWVQLLGAISIVALEAAPPAAAGEPPAAAGEPPAAVALAALAAKYRQYADRRPPGPLLRLTVERTLHWRASA